MRVVHVTCCTEPLKAVPLYMVIDSWLFLAAIEDCVIAQAIT